MGHCSLDAESLLCSCGAYCDVGWAVVQAREVAEHPTHVVIPAAQYDALMAKDGPDSAPGLAAMVREARP